MYKEIKKIYLPLIFMLATPFLLGYICGVCLTKNVASEIISDIELSEDVEELAIEDLGMFEITAYCPCEKCCGKNDGITASGTVATAGRTIAGDTNLFPFGTELIINGNSYIVEDRGGAIKGKKLDIFFDTHEEAVEFGRQHLNVQIKGDVKNV